MSEQQYRILKVGELKPEGYEYRNLLEKQAEWAPGVFPNEPVHHEQLSMGDEYRVKEVSK